MNHVALDVPSEKIDEYVGRLRDAGVDCTEVANHDDSEFGIAEEIHPGVFVRSIYFLDPDGIKLEGMKWGEKTKAAKRRRAAAKKKAKSSK